MAASHTPDGPAALARRARCALGLHRRRRRRRHGRRRDRRPTSSRAARARSRPPTRTSSPSPRRTAAFCACWSRRATRSARSRSARAHGYSAIWIGLGLRETGGHLTTIEYDPARAATAADNIRRAGLSDIVTVVPGDAFKEIPKLAGTFDFVFLDAWKRDYKRFFDLVLPAPRRRAASSSPTTSSTSRARCAISSAAIEHNPALATSIVRRRDEGHVGRR